MLKSMWIILGLDFYQVLICWGFIVSELFYALEVVFHVFIGMKNQKEIN